MESEEKEKQGSGSKDGSGSKRQRAPSLTRKKTQLPELGEKKGSIVFDLDQQNQKQVDFICNFGGVDGNMKDQAEHLAQVHLKFRHQSSIKPQAQDGVSEEFCTLHYSDK